MKPLVDLLLFGGAFDPPHIGHTTVVEQVLEQKIAKQVMLMPVGQHPFNKFLSPQKNRLELIELAFEDLLKKFSERLRINTFEINQTEITYTYDTLLHMQNEYPGKKLGLLIGSDNVTNFGEWKYGAKILELCSILVYPRAGYVVQDGDLLPGMRLLTQVSQVVASSTAIREVIAMQESVDDLKISSDVMQLKISLLLEQLDPKVLHYIQDHLLVHYVKKT